ncbi:MAG: hypothetical protein KAH38_07995 [Candidatus Hydrogenedentes bacterium]|nr:hypothetical protein [Candidatus Hydrogenedentota bacterium]
MSKKNKVTITSTDDFAEVEADLSSAMEMLDGANARIELLLQDQNKPEAEETDVPPSDDSETTVTETNA